MRDTIGSAERLGVPAHLMQGRPGDHYVLRVVGDSMREEGVFDGDYVICMRTEAPVPGDLAVCAVGDDVTIKRWHPEGETVRLVAADPALPSVRVPAKDVSVIGVVVGLMRRFARGETAP